MISIFLPFILCCTGYAQHEDSISQTPEDTIPVVVTADSISLASEDIDWTLDEFKKHHYDEWVVVKQTIDLQQKKGDSAFPDIDKLVREYIVQKKVRLPSDRCKQIKKIDEICKSKFDLSQYDYSNMGMHIADGTSRTFDMYIDWLYRQEAARLPGDEWCIDIDKELELFGKLNDALYDICDSIAFCMAGSGAWAAWSNIHSLSIDFCTYTYQAVLGVKPDTGRELDVPLDMFDDECAALVKNYKPYEDDQPIDATPIVSRYQATFHRWHAYRKSVAAGLKDRRLKKYYESITYSYARTHLLHLKNRYNDIGMTSSSMAEVCLDYNCSNKELLEYSFEKKCHELFGF